VGDVSRRHAGRKKKTEFRLDHLRRREIERHARHVGAADTDDLDRWLIAWSWHNRQSSDPIWAITNAAHRMGRPDMTDAEASAITEEGSITRKHLNADNLARFLGVTYAQRQALRLTTIGSIDVKKRARKELRKRRDRIARERKRRALGMRPQSESLSATQPWKELGMSRRTWERRRNRARDATLSTAVLLKGEDRLASPEGKQGWPSGAVAPKKETGLPSSQTATTLAADVYATLPLELRLAALCLPVPENLARAKIGVAA
jgi:hypothetical protein